jgi:SepF-like predicted cell division protein (DUF552 family)
LRIQRSALRKRLNSQRTNKNIERRSLPGLSNILRKPKKTVKQEAAASLAVSGKTYLKAMPLRDLSDLEVVKNEVKSGNIVILRITQLANKSIDDVKRAVDELCDFAGSVDGDIARLGEERVVICPSSVKIWREKTPIPNEPIPTAA